LRVRATATVTDSRPGMRGPWPVSAARLPGRRPPRASQHCASLWRGRRFARPPAPRRRCLGSGRAHAAGRSHSLTHLSCRVRIMTVRKAMSLTSCANVFTGHGVDAASSGVDFSLLRSSDVRAERSHASKAFRPYASPIRNMMQCGIGSNGRGERPRGAVAHGQRSGRLRCYAPCSRY